MKRVSVPDIKSEHVHPQPINVVAELYRLKKQAEQTGILKYLVHLCRTYKNFSKQNTLYSIGDIVGLSSDQPNVVRFVGRIVSIWNVSHPHEVQCIDVNWYYTKIDLPEDLRHSFISSSEVFPSDVTTSMYAANIVRKLKILSEKEGNEASNINVETERLSRASFSRRTSSFNPAPELWQRSCVCLYPINLELVYVQCDKCQEWLHNQPECTGLSVDEVDKSDNFVCQRCQDRDS